MFEALMPDLFVPEASGDRTPGESTTHCSSKGRSSTAYKRPGTATGFAVEQSAGGYREYGVDMWGWTSPATSDQERTSVDPGFFTVAGTQCRPPQPPPEDYGDGVVTPHAVFLALPYATDEALENLANLRENFDAYGPGGVLRRGGGA